MRTKADKKGLRRLNCAEYPLLWRKHDRNSSGTETVLFLYLILLEKNKSQNNRRGTNIYHPAAVV